jgi:Tfp pilus assembly protein PilF
MKSNQTNAHTILPPRRHLAKSSQLKRLLGLVLASCAVTGDAGPDQAHAQPLLLGGSTADANSSEPDALPPEYPGRKFRAALDGGLALLTAATSEHPADASNFVALADTHIMRWCFGFVVHDEAIGPAEQAARQALVLDSQSAAAHTLLGVVAMSRWHWDTAESEFQRGIERDPTRAAAHHWYALYLAAMGRHGEALRASEQAVALDPSPGMRTGLGAVLYFGRDFPRMIREMRKTVSQVPDFAPGYDWLGMAYVQQRRFDESIAAYRQAVAHSQGLAEIVAGLGHAYARAGQEPAARKVLADLQSMSDRWHIPPVQRAYVHIGLGEHDQALRLLETAYHEKSWELAFMRVEPWFDDVCDQPRFKKIVERLDFPSPE